VLPLLDWVLCLRVGFPNDKKLSAIRITVKMMTGKSRLNTQYLAGLTDSGNPLGMGAL
jgi:hypothetical protein